jgi:competence ComEA-like helix-hairpin-helix protein
MTRSPVFALSSVAAALLLAVSLCASAPQAQTPPIDKTTRLPESAQTKVYVRVCAHCHSLDRIETRHRTKSEWSATIEQMLDDGAEMTDEEYETILDVLIRNFGAVSINRAAAEDLVTVLAISSKDAGAIVVYRTAHGNFADFEALKKVPDVDVSGLETRKDAIRY